MKLKLPANKIFIAVITLLLISIGGVITVSIFLSKDLDDAARMVSHTQDVLIHSQKALTLVVDDETASRGYMLSGQKAFLEPLKQAEETISFELSLLKVLTAANPLQQRRIDTLTDIVRARFEFSNSTNEIFEKYGFQKAMEMVKTGEGLQYSNRIRVLVKGIQETENALLQQQRNDNDDKANFLKRILFSVVAVIILLIIFFVEKVKSDFAEKKATATMLANMNKELEQRVLDRTNELLLSKNRLEETLLRMKDGFMSIDKNWNFTYVNQSAGKHVYREPEDLIGKNLWVEFPGLEGTRVQQVFQKAMADQQYASITDYYPPIDKWQENNIYPTGDGFSIFIRDITQERRKAKELEESNLRYEYATRATSDAIWDWDIVKNTIYWGEGFRVIFGYNLPELLPTIQSWTGHLHPEDNERVITGIYTAIDGTESNWNDEYRYLKADGTYAYVYNRAFVIRDENGKPLRMVGAMQDITERNAEEQRLKLLQSVVENANDAVVIAEAPTADRPYPSIVYINNAYTKITGYAAEDMLGKSPNFLQGPNTDEEAMKRVREAVNRKESCEETKLLYTKGGDEFWINAFITPMLNAKEEVTHWISIQRDITRQKISELQKALLAEISREFYEDQTLNSTLEKSMEMVAVYGGFDVAEVWLVDADQRQISLAAHLKQTEESRIFYEGGNSISSFGRGVGLPGITWESKKNKRWDNITANGDFVRKEAALKAGLHTFYSLPLFNKNEVIGVLMFGTKGNSKKLEKFTVLFEKLGPHLGAEIIRKKLDQELNQIFSFAPDIICVGNMDGYFTKINPAASELLGYTQEELLAVPFIERVHAEDRDKTINAVGNLITGTKTVYFESRFITKSGDIKWLSWSSTPSVEEKLVFAVAKDITDRKNLEELFEKASNLARMGTWELDVVNGSAYWSKLAKEIHEVPADFVPDHISALSFYNEQKEKDRVNGILKEAFERVTSWDVEHKIVTGKGNERWIRVVGESEFKDGKCVRLFGSFQDIDARKKAELAVLKVLQEKSDILESIGDAFYTVDRNWTITYWNNIAVSMLNKSREEVLGKNLWHEFPESVKTPSYNYFQTAVRENTVQHYESKSTESDDWFEVSIYPSSTGLSVYFKNITQRKLSEIKLRELNENLERQAGKLAISNKELEQFAYVASHDLQEPLRMVTSFVTQLDLKYGDLIDEKGRQYIHFAVDGAKRMRQIILDLLEFSKIGRLDNSLESVDLNELVTGLLGLFRTEIEEKSALIKVDNLPVLKVFKAPLRQVFQNLISNSLKYNNAGKPLRISISAADKVKYWEFSVADTGIGIPAEYFEKIFVIFQRLHNKDEYSGTGIGLAITKKIIDNMGGKIWVQSEEGKGTTIYFTILKQIKS